jgi:hypothetical protein
MKIQVAANLHLERYTKTPFQPLLKPVAPILALTGNIGVPSSRSYRDLLFYCSRNWDQTIVVGGPVEISVDPQMTRCSSIAASFSNVHVLHKHHIDCDGLTFIGAPQFADKDLDWIIDMHTYPVVLVSHTYPSIFVRVQVHAAVSSSSSEKVVEVNTGTEDYRDPLLLAASDLPNDDTIHSEQVSQIREEQKRNLEKAQMR